MDLQLTHHHSKAGSILRCAGRLVAGPEIQFLETALDRESFIGCPVILNLSAVTRLDSTGMGALVRYTATMDRKNTPLRLVAVPRVIMDLIRLTHLDQVLHLFATEDDALHARNTSSTTATPTKPAQRILVYDPSPDLCAFIRSVLTQSGLDVRTACSLHDAKTLLQANRIDRVLVGPGTLQMPSAEAAKSLKAVAPKTNLLQLDPDFRTRDAKEATRALLQMFSSKSQS